MLWVKAKISSSMKKQANNPLVQGINEPSEALMCEVHYSSYDNFDANSLLNFFLLEVICDFMSS